MQLSVKIDGAHLLNLRADTSAQLSDMLTWSVENREAILAATAALEGTRKAPEAAPPVSAPRATSAAPAASLREIGPIGISGVDKKQEGKDGKQWKSPMYIVKFTNGESGSTFDGLVGKAAMSLYAEEKLCFATLEPSPKNPKYSSISSIRVAS